MHIHERRAFAAPSGHSGLDGQQMTVAIGIVTADTVSAVDYVISKHIEAALLSYRESSSAVR